MSEDNSKKQENIDFFYEHLEEYLKNKTYKGKFLVIHNKEIHGAYDEFPSALEFALVNLPKDEFAIQQVIADDEQINFIKSAM
jgi:hypothetical protein